MLHGLGQGVPAGSNNRVRRLILKGFIGIGDEYKGSKDLEFVPTSPPTMGLKRGRIYKSQPEPKKVCHDNANKEAPSGHPPVTNTSIQNAPAIQNPMYSNQIPSASAPSTAMPTTSISSSAVPSTSMPTAPLASTLRTASMPAVSMPAASMPSTSMLLQNLNQLPSFISSGSFNQNWAFLPEPGQTSPYPPMQQSQNMVLPPPVNQAQLYPMQQSQPWYPSAQNGSMGYFSFQPNLSNQQHNFDNSSFLNHYQNGGLQQSHQNGQTPPSAQNAHTPQSNFNDNNSPHLDSGLPVPMNQTSSANVDDTDGGSQAPNAPM
mgnify:CR=1 FL=1